MSKKKSGKGPGADPRSTASQVSSAKAQADLINDEGEGLYLSGNREEALGRFMEAIKVDPGCVHAYNNIGVYHWDAGNLDISINWFQKALKINPDDIDALTNLADIRKITNRETSISSPVDEQD